MLIFCKLLFCLGYLLPVIVKYHAGILCMNDACHRLLLKKAMLVSVVMVCMMHPNLKVWYIVMKQCITWNDNETININMQLYKWSFWLYNGCWNVNKEI